MAHNALTDPVARAIGEFLDGIGIAVAVEALPAETFLAGVTIRNGALVVDPRRLQWPGDLLHEAGHIAVTAPESRATLCDAPDDPGDEMAAIAWSWAAAMAIGLDPRILFHQGGYRGGGDALVENFSAGRYVGVPLLHYYGMTVEPRSAANEADAYPQMAKWLR